MMRVKNRRCVHYIASATSLRISKGNASCFDDKCGPSSRTLMGTGSRSTRVQGTLKHCSSEVENSDI